MIPKLIHQTAKTSEIPDRWRRYQQLVRDLHPGWTYRLWTDEDNLAFVRAEMPDFVDVFTGLPKNIMRADVIRYVLMYKLGGLYLDLDYEMLKPFDLTQYDCVLPQETPGEFGPESRIANAVFASSPGHPFFKAVLDELRANPPRDPGVDVLTTTGPAFITGVLRRLPERDRVNMLIPPSPVFSPTSPRSPRAYRAILDEGGAYGIHHCHGTWRELTLPQYVKMKIGHLVRRFVS